MKFASTILLLISALVLAGCGDKVENNQAVPGASRTADRPAVEAAPAAQQADVWKGEIIETMNSGGYSYVKFMKDGQETWAAGPQMSGLSAGDAVLMTPGMMMTNFHAKSLDRDFPRIYFVGSLSLDDGSAPAAGSGMSGMMGGSSSAAGSNTVVAKADVGAVPAAEGGFTVESVHTGAAALANQNVKVRGRVVKFSPNIMGTNWIHIQDGTGDGPDADLTVTTQAAAEVGDLVLVEGRLSVNKDFGAGYKYAVIVEGAKVTKE